MLYDDKPCFTCYEAFYLTHNGKILLAHVMDGLRLSMFYAKSSWKNQVYFVLAQYNL